LMLVSVPTAGKEWKPKRTEARLVINPSAFPSLTTILFLQVTTSEKKNRLLIDRGI
jgi:hypothetical protein